MWNNRPIIIRIKRHENVHPFIQTLHAQHVPLKRVVFREQEVSFETTMHYLPKIRRVRRRFRLKMTVFYADELQVVRTQLWTLLGMALMMIIPLLCAQVIWRVDIEAATPEIEERLGKTFQDIFHITTPLSKKNIPSNTMIRQKLLEQHRELSWVHIDKHGGRIILRPQESPKQTEQSSDKLASHLLATKSGVITHFNIQNGERKISVNDTAYEGDVLVSGVIDSGTEQVFVGAKGEVFADYWLECSFKIPTKITLETLQQKQWRVLIKGIHQEQVEYVQKKDLPNWLDPYVSIVEEQQTKTMQVELDESKIESLLIPLLHEKVLRSLPAKTIIKKENLLQAKWGNGTVEGKVLFLINENIANPIQGLQGE
ncbi:sporulation protein YqfD [Lysinibacillus macroides]|uniref:Stage IV sporulation protein n=1 Tax=Lysinibacillus macroides TaxID=33935 RepID=A0A0M9DIL8_9BACI|nr:sporulation protein YqfD [Lysinibacillus macroides]KOY80942.1 stage IV sporulation protein [Lysinibacillus macroides]QPR68914.1 sporulation protein YqfD [Lysinibacillus macroides]